MASARNRHSTATTAYTASDSAADGTNDTNARPARGMTKVVSQVEINPNTNWMSQQPGVWAFYVLILLLIYLMFAMVDPKDAWTLTSTVHFLITFYLFHWHKGTPLEFGAAGEYDHLTYWEQMDILHSNMTRVTTGLIYNHTTVSMHYVRRPPCSPSHAALL